MSTLNTSIIVADGARARFFTVDQDSAARPRIAERAAMIHPEHQVPGHEAFGQGRSASRGGKAGRPHILDDHRDAHRAEADRRFAAEIEPEAARMMRDHGIARFVVVAEPRSLGRLRTALAPLQARVRIDEVPHDLAGRTPHEIEVYLAERGVI